MLGISAILSMCSGEGMKAKLQCAQRERQRAPGTFPPCPWCEPGRLRWRRRRQESSVQEAGAPNGYVGHKEGSRGHTSGPTLVGTRWVRQPGGFHHCPLFLWFTSTFLHFQPEYKAQIPSVWTALGPDLLHVADLQPPCSTSRLCSFSHHHGGALKSRERKVPIFLFCSMLLYWCGSFD